jgi:hypothetical protein
MGTAMKRFFILLPVLYSAASLAASPLGVNASLGYAHDDNVTRAELDSDIESDNILGADISAAWRTPVNTISYASIRAKADVRRYLDFTKLSNTRLGFDASYHIKPFAGYTAMKYFARLGYERRLYDSDQRDGSATQLEIGLSKRLTDVLTLRAGYGKESVSADSSVFETDVSKLYVDFDYRLAEHNTLYTTISRHDGDIVATAAPTQKLIDASWGRLVRDDAFLDLAPPRWAYRLDATTTAIKLGDNYAIDAKLAIDVSLFYYSSSAYGGNDYSGTLLRLDYLYRY